MSWFGSSKYALFEENIEKATSESIPNGDIDFATALEISDLIRSKQVPPKEAMRILKKRLMNAENLNMQKSAFKLIDFCIKNGGTHFIAEIATKEFMDPLVVMLRDHSINESLKNYILENIQTWSIMVSTNKQFDYINKTYTKLQDEGFEFPAINDLVDPNLIDSKVAPEWQDSDACMMCSKMFTFINRKHHCRSCGGVFCSAHSDKTIELPELGINIPVRVCDNCYTDQKSKRKKHKHSKSGSINKKTDSSDDDEIKRAIELSLKESTRSTVSDSLTSNNLQPTQFDDEDEAMKAAIQASLQDLGMSNSMPIENVKEPPVEKSTGLYENLLPEGGTLSYGNQSLDSSHVESATQNAPEYESSQPQHQLASNVGISAQDEISIVQFVDLVDRVKKKPAMRNQVFSELLRLQAEMVLLNPKINKTLEKESNEIEKYQVLYSKLFTINKLYDDIIQKKLRQDQELAKMQSSQKGINFSSFSNFNNKDPSVPYTSSQFAYTQAPNVPQLQNTGSFTSDFVKPISYAQLPTQRTQKLPQNALQQHTIDPVSYTSELKSFEEPGQQDALKQTPSVHLNGLDSLQYAPVPENNESSKNPLNVNEEPVGSITKEHTIVNLIDL